MKFDLELILVSLRSIKALGLRSNLTILGIIIGLAAIIALVSLGNSLQISINEQFNALGQDTLTVQPGKSQMTSMMSRLEEKDVGIVESVKGVRVAFPIYMTGETIEFKGKRKSTLLIGVDASKIDAMKDTRMIEIASGNLLAGQGTVMIGNKTALTLFDKEIKTGHTIKINEKSFKVIGILAKPTNMIARFVDSAVILDEKALQEISASQVYPSRIMIKLENNADVIETKARIVNALKRSHGEEDFQVSDASQIAESANSIIGMLQIVLGGIAFIALLVGGLGIMNTMYMSVLERTKEIGVMKAVGATNYEIMLVFLSESALIGLIGGVLGIILGSLIALIVSIASESLGMSLPFGVNPAIIIFGLLFSVVVGIVSGLIPAQEASKLDPVEALRR